MENIPKHAVEFGRRPESQAVEARSTAASSEAPGHGVVARD